MAGRLSFIQGRLWVYLVAALLPLVLFSLTMLAVFNRQQHNAMEALMREASNSASYGVDSQVSATIAVLSSLAASSEFRAEDWQAFDVRARPVAESAGWLNLVVTDDEKQIFNLHGIQPIVDHVGLAEALGNNRPAVSNLVPPGPNNIAPAVVVRIPVRHPGRAPRTLAAFVPSAAFNRLLNAHMPPEWKVALADRNGTILARSHLPEKFVGTPLAPTVFTAWRAGRREVFDAVTKEGVTSYGRIAPAGGTGWVLAMGAPKESVDGIFRMSRYGLWLGGAVAAALTVLLTHTFLKMAERNREAERRRAELAAEQRLNFALECAGAGMWDWDLATGNILWSKEYYKLYGLPGDVLPSYEAWLKSLHPDDLARALAYIEEVVDGGSEEFRLEFRIHHPEKGLRWLLGSGRVISGPDGKPRRVSGVNIDITDRKRMEGAMHDALGEAERANLAKSRFLAAASHDIRQPIQSLMLFVHALTEKLKGSPVSPIVHKVAVALQSLKLLLDSILDISKLDAGLITPTRSSFPLGDFLRRMAAEYQPRMAAKGLSFRVVAGDAFFVESDSVLLGRIVGNLLENALKYTHRGGVLLGFRLRGDGIAIAVYDTGVGIPPEHQGAIFEEFVQVGSEGRDRAQGMGLGLATVRRMAALLGHPIRIRSEPGRGSAFSVEVPRSAAVAVASPSPAEAAPAVGTRILVVDDETTILEAMRVLLEGEGHAVAVAASADEAVERVRAGFRPDVVLTDYRLPEGRSGAEVINRVRQASGRTVPCVVLTGDTEVVAADLPATILMHKPVDPVEMQRVIGRVGGGRRGGDVAPGPTHASHDRQL